jgi:hypothetical protein
MKPSGTSPAQSAEKPGVDEKETGLPLFQTWPSVYLFVFVAFVLCLMLLTALSRAYP